MGFSGNLVYRFSQGVLGIACIVSLLAAAVLTVHVLFPSFHPYIKTGSGSVFGFTDYEKGIPFTTEGADRIPDTSLRLDYRLKGGGTSSLYTSRDGHGVNDEISREVIERHKEDTLVAADTITASYYWRYNDKPDPDVRGAEITSIRFFLWPRSLGRRLLLFLPVLVNLLALAYCSWQLSYLMELIVRGEAFRRRGSKRLARVAYTILLVQLFHLLYEFSGVYYSSIRIDFNANVKGFRMPVGLGGHSGSAIDLQWLLAGCILLIIAKGFERGDRLQENEDLTV